MTQGQLQRDSAGSARRGGLVDLVAVPSTTEGSGGIPLEAWLKLAVLGGMLIVINYRQFPIILRKWIDDPNWSHGFLIPLFSAFLIYTRWGELVTVRRRSWLWGLGVLLVAVVLEVAAYNDGNPWACQIGMLLVAFGLVLYLGGPALTKLLWLPIFYLVFALPFPDRYYNQLALPLQNVAASASEAVLNLLGNTVEASGSTLWVTNELTNKPLPLSVEEACSGMRLLMAFVALSVFMAYMTDRALWQRVVLVVAGVPIAIMCNVIRVSITCYMFIIGHQEFGKDFMHTFAGMVMLVPAFGLLWGLGWLLNRLFVEIPDDEDPAEVTDAPEPSAMGNRSWLRRNRHFMFAVLLVAVMGVATVAQGWVEKYPVPWPQRVDVSGDLRLVAGLPDKFGPYEKLSAEQYKQFFGQVGDGERVFDEKLLAALGMTPMGYRAAHDRRQSSWYVSRIYVDTDTGPNATVCPLWTLNVYYYTGLRDKVPHVPENCLQAGGAKITSDPGAQLVFDAGGLKVPPEWRVEKQKTAENGQEVTTAELTFNKVTYLVGAPGTIRRPGVEYYIFNYNGQPMNDRLEVRLRLSNPLESHNYFAKIQFSPILPVPDDKLTAAAARKFITHMLPAVLETLPTADDVRKTEQSSGPDAARSRPSNSD